MTITAFDLEQTIISQYANSPTLVQLIKNMSTYVDPTANFDAFYDLVWNVLTAQGWGLDVWGRIVNVSRTLTVANDLVFGFEEATTGSASPFNQGTFYTGGSDTNNYALTDAAYRMLILSKAMANICNGSIPAINQILLNLFPGRGNCYVTDGLDMTMTYTFDFALTAVEEAIVAQSVALPRPAGVSFTMVINP